MIRGSAVIAAVACGMLIPCSMSGQEVGDRLRVTLGANWVVGEVMRMSPGELELGMAGGGARVFTPDGITQVERLGGRLRGSVAS